MMRTVEEHQQIIAALIPDLPTITVPLAAGRGHVLAADLLAPIDLPPFDNSAMDGYAVTAADVATLPVTLPVSRDIPAGAADLVPLAAGTAVRIMTGAPTPPGAEVIIPVELTDGGVTTVIIDDAPAPGVHFRRRGSDVVAGATVLTAGTVLGPTQLGVCAALGVAEVGIVRPARVLVLSTGTELVSPGLPLGPGQIYESNAIMLAAALAEIGAEATILQFVPDDAAAFTSTLTEALGDTDLVITTGGVSAGAYEVVKDALTGQGVTFAKVAMQPGGPQGAGRFNGVPVVTFPGNPVSAFVSFEVFLRPVLLRAMGGTQTHRTVLRVPLSEPVTSPLGKRQFRRAVLVDSPPSGRFRQRISGGRVRPWGGPGSHLLSWLAGADAMLVIPEDVTSWAEGELAEVWLLT